MKKSLRKAIMTLAAVSALSMAMCASAMAADITDAKVTASAIEDGKATVTYTGKAGASEEVTVLLLKPDADTTDGVQENEIAYIDQKTAAEDGSFEFTMPITDVAEGTKYKLMSASTTSENVTNEEANFGGAATSIGMLGDVNNDTALDVTDSGLAVDQILKKCLSDEEKSRADMNKDKYIDVSDVGIIIDNILNSVGLSEDVYLVEGIQ